MSRCHLSRVTFRDDDASTFELMRFDAFEGASGFLVQPHATAQWAKRFREPPDESVRFQLMCPSASAAQGFGQQSDFGFLWRPVLHAQPCLQFLCARTSICRQPPSDSTSPWTRLLLANGLPLSRFAWGLAPIALAHAGCTKKKGTSSLTGGSPF